MQSAGKNSPTASSSNLSAEAQDAVARALQAHQARPGPLLEVLHAVQSALGYVPAAAVPLIAAALNLSRAEVHGVITFYHHFRQHAPGRHLIQVCQAEACRSMHCEQLTQYVQRRLQLDFHGTSSDGRFTLEPVYCLGNCACAPAVMLDGTLHGRLTPEGFDVLLAALDAP
jgi:formate dehydrogenase subunit gamma